ncbi:unnamed protein product [Phytophthora fragariaefolia]|uniref:Unnamed protein product n=1 Tax=Phytophthora fragariaefolia TaxID=1490495 RepID=A0A9W7CSL6_9STRA|nr:unnamed protein product [Phytophthora fragariaefolia]
MCTALGSPRSGWRLVSLASRRPKQKFSVIAAYLQPGNDASNFFQRLRRHAAQVCRNEHEGVAIKHEDDGNNNAQQLKCKLPHAPMLIAFSGKRQFSWLFSPPLSKIESYGKQTRLPAGWPHDLRADSEVWVLPSSSGRAAMTTAQRTLPYQQLAERLHEIPWTQLPSEPEFVVKKE